METQYTQLLEKIEEQIRFWLPENPDSSWLEKVFRFPGEALDPALLKNLSLPGWDLLSRGGKRWRPLLMVLLAEALSGENGAAAAIPLSPLVEFAHNASLIHDDIEDNSEERRGNPALHILYGNDAAINSGSFLYFLATACISVLDIPAGEKIRLFNTFGIYLRRLHLGQAIDIAWHNDYHSFPKIEEYERMCRLKTGCLARLAAVLGVYCAEYSLGHYGKKLNTNLAKKLGRGAEKLGVGFQILDDVKNLTTGIPGKKRGDDIVEGKKSLPILFYIHRYPEKRDFAAQCFRIARSRGINAVELEELIAALETSGVLEQALEMGREFLKESRDILTGPAFPGTPPGLLGRLLDFISD